MFKSVDSNSTDLNTFYEVSLIKHQLQNPKNKSGQASPSVIKTPPVAQSISAEDNISADKGTTETIKVDLSMGLGELANQLTENGTTSELARTIKSLLSAIQAELIYPESAKEREIEGRAFVEICIKNQEITKIKLHKSSGYIILDQAALAGVDSVKKNRNTFQHLKNEIVLIVPVKFNLLN